MLVTAGVLAGPAFAAADGGSADWLPWLVLGAIVLFVAGIALRMFIAARFPKGYGAWASSKREDFANNNAKWDREDETRK